MMTENSKFQRTTWDSLPVIAEDEFEHTEIWEPEDSDVTRVPMLWLFINHPPTARGTIFAVQPDAIIGRAKTADIQWQDPRISREHARFTLESDLNASPPQPLHFYIWPLKSKHGVFVNGENIRGATQLNENDRIQLGDTVFVVKMLV